MQPEVPDPRRVLVIDDSPSVLKLIAARLKTDGLDVVTEADPQAGLEHARANGPDLILLDIGLPKMDGFEVCRRLKADAATRAIPVIFLTASPDTASKVKGLDLGAVDFVTKPFDQFELRARVRAALRTKKLQDMLEQQTHLDGLTGLWNRAYLDRRLEGEINVSQRYGRPLSMILADVDHFKDLNDTHGHLFGDVVLGEIATCLRTGGRSGDIIVRYGGEEFAALLTDTYLESAIWVAERLRNAVESLSLQVHQQRVVVTASFGVACSETLACDLTPDAIVAAADEALYASKHAGRNCIHVNRGGQLVLVTGRESSLEGSTGTDDEG